MKKIQLNVFDIFLIGLSALCLVLMFVASDDPVIGIIANTELSALLAQFSTGNQIIFDLSVGILASVFMFYLVVRVPEYKTRKRVRGSLEYAHRSTKEVCIEIYLSCFMPSYPLELPQELCDMKRFREFFKEGYVEGQSKWDAVANALDEERLKKLVIELELLMHDIQFTLAAVDVGDEKAFSFLKNFSRVLYRAKNWSTDYDSIKSLLGFLWAFHTGWSWVDGYPSSDPVAEIIARI